MCELVRLCRKVDPRCYKITDDHSGSHASERWKGITLRILIRHHVVKEHRIDPLRTPAFVVREPRLGLDDIVSLPASAARAVTARWTRWAPIAARIVSDIDTSTCVRLLPHDFIFRVSNLLPLAVLRLAFSGECVGPLNTEDLVGEWFLNGDAHRREMHYAVGGVHTSIGIEKRDLLLQLAYDGDAYERPPLGDEEPNGERA